MRICTVAACDLPLLRGAIQSAIPSEGLIKSHVRDRSAFVPYA